MTRRTGVALGGLILVGALLRIAHWDPGLASDDTNYMNYAAQLLQGEPFPRDVHSARLGYLAFLAAGMGLTFVSTVVCQSLGIGIFIATSLLLFSMTRRLSSDMEGLLAVFLFVWLPLDIILATSVFPDTLMTFLVLAAGLLYLIAKTEATSVRQFAIACAGGFVLGMAASVKEVAVLASVAVVIDLLVTQRDRRALFLLTGMALGGAVAISIELIGFIYLTEDPLFRARSVLSTAGSSGPRPWINPFDLRTSFYYVLVGVNSLGAFGIHGYLLLIGSVRMLSRRSPIEFFPLVLTAVLGVYLSIGSMSLTRYLQAWHAPRYFHVVVAVGCVWAAIQLYALAREAHLPRYYAVCAGILIAAVSLMAAKETDWRGTVPLAKWLATLNEDQRRELVLHEDFVRRQALENRRPLETFAILPREATNSPLEVADWIGSRGLVVDRFNFDAKVFHDLKRMLKSDCRVANRYEPIYGESWPPYKRWLGVGQQEDVLGRIWWLTPRDEFRDSRESIGGC